MTLRPPYVYGPDNPFYREAFFWDRLRAGRPIILPGDGRRLMQFVYVKDLVWACLRAIEEPAAVGHAFNIANARPLSQTEAVEALARTCKKPARFVRIPREYILRAGGHPMGPKLYFGVYFDMPPITQVTAKAQRVLKFKPADFLAVKRHKVLLIVVLVKLRAEIHRVDARIVALDVEHVTPLDHGALKTSPARMRRYKAWWRPAPLAECRAP